MANYIVQDTSLAAVADAIRAKAGGTEKLVFPAGFVDAVENISVGSAPDGSAVTFGYETRTETTQAPTGKAYYNGVLLPELPEDVLAQYPYAWIRKNNTTGYYDLVFSVLQPWYSSSESGIKYGTNTGDCTYYQVTISGSESATSWTHKDTLNTWFGLDSNRTVLWSNHDIPNGSATATDIYFKGSEPVTEVEGAVSVPVEREEQYAIASADLNELGAVTQKMAGKRSLMTVADMVYWLNRVQFIPQGNAESTFNTSDVSFAANAVGILPTVYKGIAKSTFYTSNLTFVSNAV